MYLFNTQLAEQLKPLAPQAHTAPLRPSQVKAGPKVQRMVLEALTHDMVRVERSLRKLKSEGILKSMQIRGKNPQNLQVCETLLEVYEETVEELEALLWEQDLGRLTISKGISK